MRNVYWFAALHKWVIVDYNKMHNMVENFRISGKLYPNVLPSLKQNRKRAL